MHIHKYLWGCFDHNFYISHKIKIATPIKLLIPLHVTLVAFKQKPFFICILIRHMSCFCLSCTHADDLQITLPSSRLCQWHLVQQPHLTVRHHLLISWFHNVFNPCWRSLICMNLHKSPTVWSFESSLCEHVKCLTAVCKCSASY